MAFNFSCIRKLFQIENETKRKKKEKKINGIFDDQQTKRRQALKIP